MKKVIVVLIVCFLLTGCTSVSETELQNLRQEVETLNDEVSKLKDQLDALLVTKEPAMDTIEATESSAETTESSAEATKSSAETTDFLSIQLQSSNYEDWNAVAICENATEQHLLLCAKKCASISNSESYAKAIAENICNNSSATGPVIKELSNSPYYAVFSIAATSEFADEDALIALAKECASISNSENYAKAIAENICNNSSATGPVIKELSNSPYYAVFSIAATSEFADEDALIALAKKCASISNSESYAKAIAENICNNSSVTETVLKELAYSSYPNAVAIAHNKMDTFSD